MANATRSNKRCIENPFGAIFNGLPGDDAKKIENLFVKFGKIGGFIRSRENSCVWYYFGELHYRCIETDSSLGSASVVSTVCIDSTRHYCSLCLEIVQSLLPNDRQVSKIHSYSLSTSTATLFHHLNSVHDIPVMKVSTVPADPVDSDTDKQTLELSSIEKSFEKPSPYFIFSPATNQEQLNRDFMVWLALDLEPFSMVNNRGLRYFFGKNFPQLEIPDEATLRNGHVMEVYDSLVDRVKLDLAGAATINLMFDIWTDKHHAVHYVGVRAQFIRDDWTGCVVTLSVKPCVGDSDSLSEHIINEVSHFVPRYREKLLYSTHDGTSAAIKVTELLKIENWNHCVAHALHLLLTTDSMKRIPKFVAILRKCKSIVNTLHFKTEILEREMRQASDKIVLSELLENIAQLMQLYNAENQYPLNENTELDIEMKFDCTQMNKTVEREDSYYNLQNEVSTRWNSILQMMETLLRMRAEITSALTLVDKRAQCLKAQEWALIEELTSFLQTFRCLTELVNAHITSLSLIQLIRVEVLDACTLNPNDSEELQTMKRLIKENLDKRLPLSDTAILATILDPATKALLDASDEVKEEILYNALITGSSATGSIFGGSEDSCPGLADDRKLFGGSSFTGEGGSTPVSKRMKLIQKHTHFEQATPTIKQRQEIKNYLLYNPSEQDDDPLAFWKSGKFPLLETLARRVLTQSACSVPVENMFSTIGLLLSGKRSHLAPHTANWLSFIHDNYALYFSI